MRSVIAAARLALLLSAVLVVVRPALAQQNWDEVVKAAKAEGEVDVHGGPGKVYEQVLTVGFKAAYPDIKLNFVGTSGRDVILQIQREREAGLYKWDVYVGGTPSILQTLKPAGAFAPLRPALMLPEVHRRQSLARRFRCRLDGQGKEIHVRFRLHVQRRWRSSIGISSRMTI